MSGEKKNKCCVPGCEDKFSRRHRFPKDKYLREKWVDSINSETLKSMSGEDLYEKFVCDIHFDKKFIIPGTKRGLHAQAVPTFAARATRAHSKIEDTDCSLRDSIAGPSSTNELLQKAQQKVSSPISELLMDSNYGTPDNSEQISQSVSNETTSQQLVVSKQWDCATARIDSDSTGILRSINFTRQKHLTPKCKIFYGRLRKLTQKTLVLNSRIKNFKDRLANAKSSVFSEVASQVNNTTYTFIMQQIKKQPLKQKAHRFTFDEKVLSLALFKIGGRGYHLLSKLFCLPSKRTLITMLHKIPFHPGTNSQIFNHLRNVVDQLPPQERMCAIVFDEIAIDSQLSYNCTSDLIDGMEDYGYERFNKIANHANVFMAKGVYRQWKQPLAFTFSHGPISSLNLKKMILDVIVKCQNAGLQVVATICDQGSNNVAAINSLVRDSPPEILGMETGPVIYTVQEEEIVHLFDVPHLFKGIRNNLLTKDILFIQNDKMKVAVWKDIIDFYELDTMDDTRLAVKLTDNHVYPNKIKKMNVSVMTKVFSYKVGSLMKRISEWIIPGGHSLSPSASHTADFILLMDNLFDSLNGNSEKAPKSKPLRGGISLNSPHKEFWYSSIKILESVRFYNRLKSVNVKVPSLNNLIKTIRGFLYLNDKFIHSQKVKYLLPRAFNQDCLENFFASIRTHGRRYNSPDVSHFISSFKSLIVGNFLSHHSPNSNCKADFSDGALDNLSSFITGDYISGIHPLENPEIEIEVPENLFNIKKTRVAEATIAYFAGFIKKKVITNSKECGSCISLLSYSDGNVPLEVIEASEYQASKLHRPGSYLYYIVSQALSILFYVVPRNCKERNFRIILEDLLRSKLNFSAMNCEIHANVGQIVLTNIVKYFLFFWTKQINRIGAGKDGKFNKAFKKSSDKKLFDPIKLQAYKMFLSKCKKRASCGK